MSGQNKMYMAGGEYPDGSASQAFWRYDPVLDVWQEMASMHTPRSELGMYYEMKEMQFCKMTKKLLRSSFSLEQLITSNALILLQLPFYLTEQRVQLVCCF